MKLTPLAVTVALATLMATTLPAQQNEPGQRRDRAEDRGQTRGSMLRMFPVTAAIDADGNGEISTQEIEGAVAALKSLDKDKNGKLTDDEVRPNFAGRREGGAAAAGGRGFGGNPEEFVARLMERDQNKDGKLAKDEVPEQLQSLVTRADSDKDGLATKDELTAAMQRRPGGGFGGQAGGRGPGGPPNREGFVDRALEYDTDKDGKLSKEELTKWAEQMGRGFGGGTRGGDDRPQRPQRPERANDNN